MPSPLTRRDALRLVAITAAGGALMTQKAFAQEARATTTTGLMPGADVCVLTPEVTEGLRTLFPISSCPLLAHSGHSSLRLLRYLQGVVDFDPQVADSALQLAMVEEDLHRPEGSGSDGRSTPLWSGAWCASHSRNCRVQSRVPIDAGELAGRQVWRSRH